MVAVVTTLVCIMKHFLCKIEGTGLSSKNVDSPQYFIIEQCLPTRIGVALRIRVHCSLVMRLCSLQNRENSYKCRSIHCL